jgi:TRAP-type C4-dicarboxylate transport system substrate-binding protein
MSKSMASKRRTRVAAGLLALLIALSACDSTGTDRAGGTTPPDEVRVIEMASPNDGPAPVQVNLWVEEVERASGGTIDIEIVNAWRLGQTDYEQATVNDVVDGEVDMAWVGVRAMDRLGELTFQGLVAPLLVDSHALQAEVFESGIPDHMLARLELDGITGLAVLPGPMRKLLGATKPYVNPSDFVGEAIGIQASEVADETLTALGATPTPLPSSASIEGVDGYEQQLGSILGNRYFETAGYITSNINLWPRPMVVIIGADVFASLNQQQQDVLTGAGVTVRDEALQASVEEDRIPVEALCDRGIQFATASEADLDLLTASLDPVYVDLGGDGAVAADIEAIGRLKAGLGQPADAATCAEQAPLEVMVPDGTYEMTLTGAEAAAGCVPIEAGFEENLFVMTLDNGVLDQHVEYGGRGGTVDTGWNGTYEVFDDRIELTDSLGTLTARWEFDGEQLVLSEMTGGACDDVTVWTTHPWVLTTPEGSIPRGRFVTTITAEDWAAEGLAEVAGADFEPTTGEFAMEITADNWTVFDPPSGLVGFDGTYQVFGDRVEVTGGEDTFTARWSVEGETLILSDVVLNGDPEPSPYSVVGASHPWTREDG